MLDVCRLCQSFWALNYPISCVARGLKRRWETIKSKKVTCFCEIEQTQNFCLSHGYARGNWSIIYFNDLCKLIERYLYDSEKHPFSSYHAAKHSKRSKFAITHMWGKQVNFLLYNTGVDFISRNNFANLGSFAKFSVPVQSVIPREPLCLANN